jgi:hypothetical protein
MKGPTKERWQALCEMAAEEQDVEKLLKLVTEIDRLLAEKQERLLHERKADPPFSS